MPRKPTAIITGSRVTPRWERNPPITKEMSSGSGTPKPQATNTPKINRYAGIPRVCVSRLMTKASTSGPGSASLDERSEVFSIVHHFLPERGDDSHQQLDAGLRLLPKQLLKIGMPDLDRHHRRQSRGRAHSLALLDQRQLSQMIA